MTATPTVIEARLEAPHVVYPKGPIRKIVSFRNIEDQIAGELILVKLECGHEATLIGDLTSEAIVRCPTCHYEQHKGTEQVLE